jgi:pantoate--beta-alanine ligase
MEPSRRAKFEVDYISLADPDTMEEVDQVDETKGAILSGAVRMLPIEEAQEGEELGVGGGQIPVRLIDNIVLEPVK